MDTTPRILLQKPDPDPVTGDVVDVSVLNANFDTIDRYISFTPCLSTDRPTAPFAGQGILETDTAKTYVWGGSGWISLTSATPQFTNIGIGTAPDAALARRIKTWWGGTQGATSQVLLEQGGAAAGSRALAVKANLEANERWWLDFDGKMQWGPGITGGDTTLYRASSGRLKTDAALEVVGDLVLGGRIPKMQASTAWMVDNTVFVDFQNTAGAAGSPQCGVSFVAPPSGAVWVTVGGSLFSEILNTDCHLGWELRTGAVVGSGTVVQAFDYRNAVTAGRPAGLRTSASHRVPYSGLTPGSAYNVRALHSVSAATGKGTIDRREIGVEPIW